jgi:hypothetical protein
VAAVLGRGKLLTDLIGLGRAELGEQGEGLLPVWACLAGVAAGKTRLPEAALRAGLLGTSVSSSSETARSALSSNAASTTRCFSGATGSVTPPRRTSKGPSRQNSVTVSMSIVPGPLPMIEL